MPGPNMIIACPHCGHPAKKRTYFSWNTFGAVLWSDGKQVAPMKPEIPTFVFCRKCGNLYWIKEAKEICEEETFKSFYPQLEQAEFIEFPSFMQLSKAIEIIEDKKYVRIEMLYGFNNLIRNKRESEITPEMQKRHKENLYELMELLDESDENDLIMKAEAYRNLGLFGMSESLLEKITNPRLAQIKEKFQAEIRKGNQKVFIIFGPAYHGR